MRHTQSVLVIIHFGFGYLHLQYGVPSRENFAEKYEKNSKKL